MFSAIADHSTTSRIPAPARYPDEDLSATRTVPAVPLSVTELRRFARGVVREWGVGGAVDDALALIVTELVANAVRHSGSSEVALLLSVAGGVLVIEVRDSGRWLTRTVPRPDEEEGLACGGRGLQLVEACAMACRVSRTLGGTRVVAELRLAA